MLYSESLFSFVIFLDSGRFMFTSIFNRSNSYLSCLLLFFFIFYLLLIIIHVEIWTFYLLPVTFSLKLINLLFYQSRFESIYWSFLKSSLCIILNFLCKTICNCILKYFVKSWVIYFLLNGKAHTISFWVNL